MKALEITFQDIFKIVDILFNSFIIDIFFDIPSIPKVVDHIAINIAEIVFKPFPGRFIKINGFSEEIKFAFKSGNFAFLKFMEKGNQFFQIKPIGYLS